MTLGPGRRWALLLVATALAAGPFAVVRALPATADVALQCARGDACVHITYPDSDRPPIDVPASLLGPTSGNDDVVAQTYNLCSRTGCTPELVTGVSLNKLFTSDLLPPADRVPLSSITYAELSSPTYSSLLRAGELADPSPFVDQLEPVFATAGSDDIEYVRPQRTAGDLNYPDRYQTGSLYRIIHLAVHTTGAVVHPTITVLGSGPRHINDPVRFATSFPASDPPHDGASFEWTFAAGDPAEPGDATTSHTYRSNDTYSVSVAVSGTDPDVGAFSGISPAVTVQIGRKTPPKKGRHPGNGHGGKKHPTSGPTEGNGHHQGSSPRGGPTAAPPTATAPGTSGSAGPTAGPTSAAPPPGPSTPDHPSATPTSAPAGGAFVQGILIEGSSAPDTGSLPTQATRAAISARQPGRASSSFDPRWLWLLVPVGLLAAGALGERRAADTAPRVTIAPVSERVSEPWACGCAADRRETVTP